MAEVTKVILADPRGFCAGVEMAIKSLVWMVELCETPVYCYHDIVHNKSIVDEFERAGVIFVNDISEVPDGAAVMLSAHGSAPEVVAEARRRGAVFVDAACPLVTKVHHEVKKRAGDGYDVVYVGHRGHDEAIGTMAVAPEAVHLVETPEEVMQLTIERPVAFLGQTTLSMDEWAGVRDAVYEKFTDVWMPGRSDLCFATTNRQTALKEMVALVDAVIIIGSQSSSNTNALERVAHESGCARVVRIDSVEDLPDDLSGIVGVTAGASVPSRIVEDVVAFLAPTLGAENLRTITEDEYFPLPAGLRGLLSTEALAADRKTTASEALGRLAARGDLTAVASESAAARGVAPETWPAPAKLTLSLRIVGVRADGYHLIDAEMVSLDLADVVEIEALPAGAPSALDVIGLDAGGPVPGGDDNLVMRALRLADRSAKVRLTKRIAPGAGLGGGSSDAAAILRWAGFGDLVAASRLGADVSFCMVGGRARVQGIGEDISPLPWEPRTLTLVTPPFGCSTPAVYAAWDRLGAPTADGPNDLEAAALVVEPRLARVRDELGDATGETPVLAGSGSTWFVPGAFPGAGRVVVTTTPPFDQG